MKSLGRAILLAVFIAGCAEKKVVVIPKLPPAPPRPVKREPPPPPPLLSPQVGGEEEDRLKQEARSRIEGAERIVVQIDQNTLAQEHQGTFLTIQSFLAKAKEALSIKDFLRAFNLADKALILAEELLTALR